VAVAGDKTEQPTPKKLLDARKKGQVFKSRDIVQALLFVVAAAVLIAGAPSFVSQLETLMKDSFQPSMMRGNLPLSSIVAHMGVSWTKFMLLSAPLLAALVVVAAGANLMQVKVLFAPEVVKPKFDKLNPVSGAKNIFFTSRTYIELVKNLVKFVVVFWVLYASIRNGLRDVIQTPGMRVDQTAALVGKLLTSIMFKVGGVFLLLGAADFMIQRKLFMKQMMMSKEEVKQEYKNEEGDPHVKHMRKHLFEQLMHESVATNVPKATAIVCNPTHISVALRYDERTMLAPRVTAKGQDSMALRIKEIAKEHGIPIIHNVGLAHGLFDLEIGHEIPEDLYEAVAEVLNFVYQLAAEEA
jgi:flagellar biosynthetic protein FlhB